MPEVKKALTDGRIGLANAQALARASGKTDAAQVAGDGDLLSKAASMPPEQFNRVANRWIAQSQADGGESDYRRQRRRRELSIWTNRHDGMTYLKGRFDSVTGTKLQDRLIEEAERLRCEDRRSNAAEQRTKPQRLADALDSLTEPNATSSGEAGRSTGRHVAPSAITIVQHLDAAGDKAFAEIGDGSTIPPSVLEEHFCNAKVVGRSTITTGMWCTYPATTCPRSSHRSASATDPPMRLICQTRRPDMGRPTSNGDVQRAAIRDRPRLAGLT